MQWVQLRLHQYWQWCNMVYKRPPLPRFNKLLSTLEVNKWNRPSLPIAYVPRQPPARLAPVNPGPKQPPPSADVEKERPVKEKPDYVRNRAVDQDLLAFKTKVKKIRLCLAVAGPGKTPADPPKADNGNELCIAFQINGGCYGNCERRSTHRTLSAAEKTRLTALLTAGASNL